MALSGSSTLAEVKEQYRANAGYVVDGSVAKCKLFVEAALVLLMDLPAKTGRGRGGSVVEMGENLQAIQKQHDRAVNWLQANSSAGGSVRHASFENLR